MSVPDGQPGDIPPNSVPVFIPAAVAAPLLVAAQATHFEGGLNGLVEWLVAEASEDFGRGDYSLITNGDNWAIAAREGEEVAP